MFKIFLIVDLAMWQIVFQDCSIKPELPLFYAARQEFSVETFCGPAH